MREQLFFEGPDVNRKLTRYWLLLLLAAVIATAGIIGDSTATVIGAMIVAPLMVPILGTLLAVVLADRDNLVRCLALVVAGAAAVIFIAWLVGVAVHEPVDATTSTQVASRISPRLIDLIAALATGAVGSFALAREDISDTLPGVAIAISLVPPLAVVGLTLEAGDTDQAIGAMLLFVTNVSAILTAGLVVMALYRVSRHIRTTEADTKTVNRRRAALVIVASLVVIAIPLTLTSRSIATTQTTESRVSDLAHEWAERVGWKIASVQARPEGVFVVANGPLPQPETDSLERDLAAADLAAAEVELELVPSYTVMFDTGG